jgi:hypothetical protein
VRDDAGIASARFAWEEGARRLDADRSASRAARQRLADAVADELRRRVGVTFTVAQLAAEYARAPEWFTELAHRMAPGDPAVWDASVAMDAGFARYARLAGDAPGRGRT